MTDFVVLPVLCRTLQLLFLLYKCGYRLIKLTPLTTLNLTFRPNNAVLFWILSTLLPSCFLHDFYLQSRFGLRYIFARRTAVNTIYICKYNAFLILSKRVVGFKHTFLSNPLTPKTIIAHTGFIRHHFFLALNS